MELTARYTPVSPEKSEATAHQMIWWCRDYFKTRVNSRWIDERRCIPPHIVLDLGNRGIFGYHIDAALGGTALRARDWIRVLEQLGSLDPTISQLVLINALANRTIASFAPGPLKTELLPQLARGRMLAAFAQTEKGAGTNFMAMQTLAEEDGPGWRLSGEKSWIGNAGWASIITVIAKTKAGAMVALAVRPDAPGVRMGVELNTMGLRGVVQNMISFENVRVPATHLLGTASQGGEVAVDAMTFTRLGISAQQVGCMKRCIQLMYRYASRRTIATGSLLRSAIAVSFLSQCIARMRLAEALVIRLAQHLDDGAGISLELAAVAKIVTTEFAGFVADHAVQLLGGRGYEENNLLPQIVRDLRVTRIFEGPTEALAIFVGKRMKLDLGARNLDVLTPDAGLKAMLVGGVQAVRDGAKTRLTGSDLTDQQRQEWTEYQLGMFGCWTILAAAHAGAPEADPSTQQWLDDAIRRGMPAIDSEDCFLPQDVIRTTGEALDAEIGDWAQDVPALNWASDEMLR